MSQLMALLISAEVAGNMQDNRKESIMKYRRLFILAAAIAAALLVAGVAAAGDVQVRTMDKIGKYLADGKGMTLYHFKNDAKDKIACTGPCLEKWPLFSSEKITPPPGTGAMDFGVITRPDGKKQTTFKGWPLYYFAGDKKPGDTNGQGIKDAWYVVSPVSIEPYF
jgi:predicted lipoprotein with Yx(FWY)xxD motif